MLLLLLQMQMETSKHTDKAIMQYPILEKTVLRNICLQQEAQEVQLDSAGLCAGALTAPFTAIAIGNGSSAPTIAAADTRLGKEAGGNGLDRIQGLVTFTNATASASAITLIQGTFGPWTGGTTTTIQEAGLFNSTTDNSTTGGMFAHILIPSPPTLNPGDSITIKYTVNVG